MNISTLAVNRYTKAVAFGYKRWKAAGLDDNAMKTKVIVGEGYILVCDEAAEFSQLPKIQK